MSAVTICGDGPHVELKREAVGIKWCFACRKHIEHDWVVYGSTEPSYWGPWCRYECGQCKRDHTLGFGMVREWDVE